MPDNSTKIKTYIDSIITIKLMQHSSESDEKCIILVIKIHDSDEAHEKHMKFLKSFFSQEKNIEKRKT